MGYSTLVCYKLLLKVYDAMSDFVNFIYQTICVEYKTLDTGISQQSHITTLHYLCWQTNLNVVPGMSPVSL